jgi:hypothetical protein
MLELFTIDPTSVATGHMIQLEQSPERVMSFFQHPRVKYAA